MKKLGYKGFTLIELLIVIVIIGILAGVVLQILNPAKQQRRARDGVTKSAMEKLALAFGAYNSAYGTFPPASVIGLQEEMENESGLSCAGSTCTFNLSNSGAVVTYTYSTTGTDFSLSATALEQPPTCGGGTAACTLFRIQSSGRLEACTSLNTGCVNTN